MLVPKPLRYFNEDEYYYNRRIFVNNYDQRFNPYSTSSKYDLRFIVVRHAERLDVTLGDQWYSQIFGNAPQASPDMYANPILPQPLPYRSRTYLYDIDPPITRRGQLEAFAKGQQLRGLVSRVDHCYSSPACRCVITASAILQGMGQNHVRMRPEPALFEPLAWNPSFKQLNGDSPFLSVSSWLRTGYNVDGNYQHAVEYLDAQETEYNYYHRSNALFQKLQWENTAYTSSRKYDYDHNSSKTVLIVGHAATPVIFSMIARNQRFSLDQLTQECNYIQYLDAVILSRLAGTNTWTVTPVKQF